MWEKLRKFFNEVKSEVKKTTWPNREELIASTGVVLIILAATSLFLFLIDLVFAGTLGALLRRF